MILGKNFLLFFGGGLCACACVCVIHNGKCWFGNELLNFTHLTKPYVKRNKSESF